jgi:transcriptional regulator with XRE-family HTH domain
MNLTQEELGGRCDLSKGFISQLERDKVSPSIATLVDILECLGSNPKEFFSGDENESVVYTREDIFSRRNDELGHGIDWLIPNAQKNTMEPILIKLAPGGRSETYPPYEGEVFGYVLSGSVVLNLNGRKNRVKHGESFYYKANDPYFIQNSGRSEAAVIWVTCPPSF